MEIDFVITWLDGNDPAWKTEKDRFRPRDTYGDLPERYRDWKLLRYWFRGVERYAPWVRKIHLVTWGHVPDWLVQEHKKLSVVRHDKIMPAEILPVFNSALIELYLHRIPQLAEQFVFFNDDMFLLRPVQPTRFFKKGLPCDMAAFGPIVANPNNPLMSHIFLNNMLVLAKYFDKRECVRRHPGQYFHLGYPPLYFFYNLQELMIQKFTGMYTMHGPSPLCKRTFAEVWDREEAYLRSLSGNRFRCDTDVNQYLFREWQKLSGRFYPTNVQKGFRYFEITDDNRKLLHTIASGACSMVCINDTGRMTDADREMQKLIEAFERRLPDKCSYEKARRV
ncbi:MAG: Stealth CR1 domain-containing protein [Lachnospiraceae bacterium]|nr:Stealth CR1 domain-containing protein [Lachnospiraceae bacterium]